MKQYKIFSGREYREYTLAELKDIAIWADHVVKDYRANNKMAEESIYSLSTVYKVNWASLFRLLEAVERRHKTLLPKNYSAQYYD